MKTAVLVAMRRSILAGGIALAFLPFAGRAQYSADYQTNTINGVTNNWSGNYLVGSNYVGDVLRIQNAGVLNDSKGYVGFGAACASNAAIVTGSGSAWNSVGELDIGKAGSGNSLTIANSGLVVNAEGYIGNQNGANYNTVLVGGSGSVWSNGAHLFVGYAGVGDGLTVSNGGAVFSASGYLGYQGLASNNAVLVTGPGAVWNAGTNLSVGYGSIGNSLTIANSGLVVSTCGYVGDQNHADRNSSLVTGSGSVWSNGAHLFVGYAGVGDGLTISNGGAVFSASGYLGYQNNARSNSVLVAGSGSVWNNSTNLYVGYMSVGNSLRIANSGGVFSASSYIGYSNSARGNAILVTGPGSVFSNSADLYLGYSGSGNTLTITNGGAVFSTNGCYVGYNAGSTGNSILVTGPGSTLGNGTLCVGYSGTDNSVTFANGSTNRFLGDMTLGDQTNSSGRMLVTDCMLMVGTNLWPGYGPDISPWTTIGRHGSGQMIVSNSIWQSYGVIVGDQTGSRGTLTMSGSHATFGAINQGVDYSVTIAANAGTTGTVLISDSLVDGWKPTPVYLGSGGVGQMSLSNTTYLASGTRVGGMSGSQGTLILAADSRWEATGLFYVGDSAGSVGTVSLTDSVLILTNGNLKRICVGMYGLGQMIISNSLVRTINLYVGMGGGNFSNAGTGVVTMTSGQIETSDLWIGGEYGAFGDLRLLGGRMTTAGNVYIGFGRFGAGQMTVSNGTWLADTVTLGSVPGAYGTLTLAGGTNDFTGLFQIGYAATNSDNHVSPGMGAVQLINGLLTTTNDSSVIGVDGIGRMTVTGGTWLAQDVYVAQNADAEGALTLAGGMTTLNHLIATNTGSQVLIQGGTLNMRGGVFRDSLFIVGDGVGAPTVNLLDDDRNWNTYSLLIKTNATLNLTGLPSMPGAVTNFGTMVIAAPNAQFENRLNNAGTLAINPDSLLTVIPAWTNAGTVTLGDDAVLGGGALYNVGLIQGGGIVNTPLVNGPGGRIELAEGNWLTLRDAALNQGAIANHGGYLDMLATTFTNAGVMSGYGLFTGNAMVNEGSVLLQDGASTFYGNYLNAASGTTLVDGVAASFYGTVTNSGTMQGVNGGKLEFYGTVVNDGVMNYVLGQATFYGTNGLVDTDFKQAILHGTLINHGIVLSPDDDYDSDSFNNFQEYVATSDATDPASYFRITVVSNDPSERIYLEPSSTGRLYSLQWSADPLSYSWLDVPGQTNMTGGPAWLTDTNTASAVRFHRVIVNMP